VIQSISPLNYLLFPDPISAANLVLAKSSGYTKHSEVAPAAPPEATLPKKNLYGSLLGSYGLKKVLYVSLKAKFKAWVGKYLRTFARFPLHNDNIPSSLYTLTKQLIIPVNFLTSPD